MRHGRRHHHPRWEAGWRWRYANPVSRYFRMRLHRRIFFWFGASIVLTMFVSGGVMGLVGSGGWAGWTETKQGAEHLAGDSFERVWDDPKARADLAQSFSRDLGLDVTVHDARTGGQQIFGAPCKHREYATQVVRAGQVLGTVEGCRTRRSGHFSFLFPLFVAGFVIWLASGRIARRLTRPLGELVHVTQEIGAGNLKSRAHVNPFMHGEAGALGVAINDMAERIEKQVADQRELLAAVSHELRTPLARIRLLTELARGNGSEKKTLDELDQEVVEIDALVGDLLASSRLDFSALSIHRLDAVTVARRAVERAGISAEKLSANPLDTQLDGDATLLARALANLIDNASRHGGGVAAVRVEKRGGEVAFEVDDQGKGFHEGDEGRAFDAFFHRARNGEGDQGGLGLGLSLVKRIAQAHGGRAYAQNREGGGARVGFTVKAA